MVDIKRKGNPECPRCKGNGEYWAKKAIIVIDDNGVHTEPGMTVCACVFFDSLEIAQMADESFEETIDQYDE